MAHGKLRWRMSLAAAGAAVYLLASSASALAPNTSVILGGRYDVVSTQGAEAGEITVARTKPRMLAGSGVRVDYQCKTHINVDEVLLVGVTVAPNGHFALRYVTTYTPGGYDDPASVQRIDGTFVTPRLARGVIWGWSGSAKDCVISSKHPVRFRARYVGRR